MYQKGDMEMQGIRSAYSLVVGSERVEDCKKCLRAHCGIGPTSSVGGQVASMRGSLFAPC